MMSPDLLLVFLMLTFDRNEAPSDPNVRAWKPARISSSQFESHPAFDPWTGDFYFVRSSPEFRGWRIYVSRCTSAGWTPPEPPSFVGNGVEADPFFTSDGSSLFFISTRMTGGTESNELDIYQVGRNLDGSWKVPTRLPDPVNSRGAEWFPRLSDDGWLYYGSSRAGGFGGNDIWRAKNRSDGAWLVENLGKHINTSGEEYEPLLSPDHARLIIMTDSGFYESTRIGSHWLPRVKLGAAINANGTEIGALFSPSGQSLLFSRVVKDSESGEFFVWCENGTEEWPPQCMDGSQDNQDK